ncbi:MAG: hypothetical protein JNK53_00890, partial [Phycisphaerae bacterium]|nr:hypothetical protein [Phycisphaerae bacterium]
MQATASAAPIGAGVVFDVKALPEGMTPAGASPAGGAQEIPANAIRVAGTLTPGGQFGAHGSVLATAIPTALIDPWVPEGLAFRATDDLGPSIIALAVDLGTGDTVPLKLDLKTQRVVVSVEGAHSADGSIALSSAVVNATQVRPELLKQYGVTVSDAVQVAVRATGVQLPPSADFNPGKIAATFSAQVSPARGDTMHVTTGDPAAGTARTIAVKSVSIAGRTASLGTTVDIDATTVVDGTTVRAVATVADLYTATGGLNWERARYDATLSAAPLTAGQLGREVPAVKEIAPTVFVGTFSVDAAYKGTLQDGLATAVVEGGATKATVQATVKPTQASVQIHSTVPVSRSFLGAVAKELPVVLGAPAVATATVSDVTLPRDGLWGFGAPSNAKVTLRVPELVLREVKGLASSIKLDAIELDAQVSLAEPMSASGTFRTSIAAIPAKGAAIRAADTDIQFSWSGPRDNAKQVWDTHIKLANLHGPGLEEMLSIPEDSRGQIGGGKAHLIARQAANGALAFELESEIDRLAAVIKGDLADDVLTLKPSEVNLNLPGPQAVALLNGMNCDGKATWHKSDPLVVRAKVQSLRMRVGGSAPAAPAAGAAPAAAA